MNIHTFLLKWGHKSKLPFKNGMTIIECDECDHIHYGSGTLDVTQCIAIARVQSVARAACFAGGPANVHVQLI